MMKKQIDINTISAEKLQFAQEGVKLADKKLQTKPRSYFKDAWIRFKKNKSSVVAACIICALILYAIIVPIFSPYTLNDQDNKYRNLPAYIYGAEWLADGTAVMDITEQDYLMYQLWGDETGVYAVEKVLNKYESTTGKVMYKVKMNKYKQIGTIRLDLKVEEFIALQEFQDANNIQIILPAVKDQSKVVQQKATDSLHNYWYRVSDNNLSHIVVDNDETKPLAERVDSMYQPYKDSKLKDFYTSKMRIEGEGNKLYEYYKVTGSGKDAVDENGAPLIDDFGNPMVNPDGTPMKIASQVSVRLSYFHYYAYMNRTDSGAPVYPSYFFGTNNYGQDIMTAIAIGASFSLILAVSVSVINFLIGLLYGSIQGFYGGMVDMVLDRISDILSGVPFMVVATLFQLHLAAIVGPVVSLLFAFVATGWIGTAALVRKQFYRFKGQEYVTVAKSLGASDSRIMFKHIFPNSLGTIVTSCALVIPGVISSETMLTYLGIIKLTGTGLTTLGIILSDARNGFVSAPHTLLIPSLYLALLLISFNLFGNGLRDAFNPSLRGSED